MKPLFALEDSIKSEKEIPIDKPKVQNYISQETQEKMDKAEQNIKNDYNIIEPKTLEMIGE